jgi:hypothetical protein
MTETVAPAAAPAAPPRAFDVKAGAQMLAERRASLLTGTSPPALAVVQGGQPAQNPPPPADPPPPPPEAAQGQDPPPADGETADPPAGEGEGDDPSAMQFELPDGRTVTLADLVTAHAKAAELEPKAAEFEQTAQVRQQVEQERQTYQRQAQEAQAAQQRYAQMAQQAEQRAAQYGQVLDQIGQRLDGDTAKFSGMDWNRAFAENPVQAQADMARFLQHQQAQQALAAERQRVQGEQQQAAQERTQQAIQARAAGLQRLFPHWQQEPAKAETELTAMQQAAVARGFDPREVMETLDPRVFGLLADAAEGRRLKAEMDGLRAKLGGKLPGEGDAPAGQAPKRIRVVAPGAAAPRGEPRAVQAAAVGSAFAKLQRTGSLQDAAQALRERRQLVAMNGRR